GADTMHIGPSATAFYRSRSWAPAWTSDGKMKDEGKALLAQLSRTGDDGLSPERYHYSMAQRLVSALGSGDDKARAQAASNLDIALSEGFARYADDLAGGTLDPKQAGLEFHLAKERAPKVQALQLIASGTRADSVVTTLRPHTVVYTRMMQALARYRAIAARGGWPMVGAGATGATGATSPDSSRGTGAATSSDSTTSHGRHARHSAASSGSVAQVRARLMAGEDSVEAGLAASGRAAPATLDANLRQAITHFQQRMGLQANGRIGPATVKALNVPVQVRMEALAVNMDRWRWLPRDLGSLYVMVNLPAFKVDVMQGDSAVMEQKVVVGKPGWNTPVFADRMVQLIVNPYWNVPKSIVAEELGPEMAKDPNYLAEHHFQPTSDGGYRQMPGPKNSLGLFKFQLTNDEDIYLHDTPAKDLFGKPDRDLSHGCIRLQDARAMAYFVGQREGISQEAIDRAQASGDNHVFDLKNPIPVYIMYFTAAVQPDGSIAFYPDVYDFDAHMAALFPKLQGQPVDSDTVARDSAAVADSLKQVKASHVGKSTA
ncbi:MAG TPA: L,D-transpeptidase family protein, partial [Longimicrobiales bacterium]